MNERRGMQIRELILPNQFVKVIQNGLFRRSHGSWQLCDGRDAYGNLLEAELGEIYETAERIQQESDLLPRYFTPNLAEIPDRFVSEPGFIPYINDFQQILAFGISGDGAPYCFDYRKATAEPSIIWWDDVYWRRVAPSFTRFIALFDLK